MNWEPTKIYQMSNGTSKVVFQYDVNRGIFLVSDHSTDKSYFVKYQEAKKLWKEYQAKNYKRI